VLALAQQLKTAEEIHEFFDPAQCAASALARIGERARPAVPMLIDLLNSGNQAKREAAALALGGIGPAGSAATASLIQALDDEGVRFRAAIALGRIGPAAEAAVPALTGVVSGDGRRKPDYNCRLVSALALIRIDPITGRRTEVHGRDTKSRTLFREGIDLQRAWLEEPGSKLVRQDAFGGAPAMPRAQPRQDRE
jgi:hypothetical protein